MIRRIALCLAIAALPAAQSTTPRILKVDDLYRVLEVGDPQVSPDGAWVAYTLSTINKNVDKTDSDIWMVRWDGTGQQQLTTSKEDETSPRWSSNGQWLAFLSSRANKEEGTQVWLLPRAGGEALQLTSLTGSVSDYAWSPDSKRLALVVAEKEEEPRKIADWPATPKPIVIDRYHFKQDVEGYRTKKPNRVWLFDIASKKAELLTKENLDESVPSWSPDGNRIAFISNRVGDAGRYADRQLCVAESKPGSEVRQLTREASLGGPDERAVWSADGAALYFLAGRERKYAVYNRMNLAVVPSLGGAVTRLTASFGRSVGSPITLSTTELSVLVIDDMSVYPGAVDHSGHVKRLAESGSVIGSQSAAGGHLAVTATNDGSPAEIYALENGKLRPLTRHNQDWLRDIRLGETREVRFKTNDGADVHGLVTLPPDYAPGTKLPTLLRIHGGPDLQDAHSFEFERQMFAASGYAVLQVNFRGSVGRDEAFQTAIFADWGGKEVVDLLAGIDHIVAAGIADPARLGIGGWSFGGILTNFTIARDGRFKAAVSGAASAMQIAMYGSDQWVEQYDLEFGFPWKAKDLWMKLSSPFFEADKIRTPTLFLGGLNDFIVPIIGSEQMYQALKANGVNTQLVIYPGENHVMRKPSYLQDRLDRYLDWYAKYLK
jgi:dipeptidyl aminopeptidase/acylaminoacyl peptidase